MTNKEIIENYQNSKDKKLVDIYLSGIYLLLNVQLDWLNDAEDIMKDYNVMNFEFKQRFNRLKKELNGFELYSRDMIKTENKKNRWKYKQLIRSSKIYSRLKKSMMNIKS